MMSEKVLGFKEKNADIEKLNEDWIELEINQKDFIPVVSLEWLEKELRDLNFTDYFDTAANVNQDAVKAKIISDAKKQAGEK